MKKSNYITLVSFIVLIAAVILFMIFSKTPSQSAVTDTTASSTVSDESAATTHAGTSDGTDFENSSGATGQSMQTTLPKASTVSMKDALFIGDSRTVGLSEYAGIEGANFFATVGMNVYNIHKKPVSVPNVGKVTLTQLLSNKKYGKIYVMLGINELGYNLETTVVKYKELLDFIREKQPDAAIFVQANLHVTKSRSDKDKVINNPAVDKLNGRLSEFADGKTVFYLDANKIFDDASGSLSADKAGDSAHPYAKYYTQWGKWITSQTAELIGEG